MKKVKIMTVMTYLSIAILAGCSRQPTQQTGTTTAAAQTESITETVKETALSDIYAQIEEEVELPAMLSLNENYISNYYGIDPSLLEEYVFSNAEEVIYADTVIMMKVKSETDAEGITEALETMLEHKKLELENYLPEQFELVDKAEIKISGSYIYLVISKDAEKIEAIIKASI